MNFKIVAILLVSISLTHGSTLYKEGYEGSEGYNVHTKSSYEGSGEGSYRQEGRVMEGSRRYEGEGSTEGYGEGSYGQEGYNVEGKGIEINIIQRGEGSYGSGSEAEGSYGSSGYEGEGNGVVINIHRRKSNRGEGYGEGKTEGEGEGYGSSYKKTNRRSSYEGSEGSEGHRSKYSHVKKY